MSTRRLSELLTPATSPARVENPNDAKYISIRLHGRGAVARAADEGKTPKPYVGNRISEGQFVYSRIWCRRGAMALVSNELDGIVVTSEFPVFDIDSQNVEPEYLLRRLLAPDFQGQLEKASPGSSGQNRINRELFLALEIDLPPITEQRRIAAILDQADAIRAARRESLARYDELTQAVFRQLSSPDDPLAKLGNIATLHSGSTLPSGEPYSGQLNGSLLMKVSDMNGAGNSLEIKSTSMWTAETTPAPTSVDVGAIIVPKRGASIATNKKRLAVRRTALDPNLMGIQPDETAVTTQYLRHWFESFDLASITSGSSVPQLNKKDLAPLLVPLPALQVQQEFARHAEAIAAQRARTEAALALDDELFASLQYRAFRGEL